MAFDAHRAPSGAVRIEAIRDGLFVAAGQTFDAPLLIWPAGTEAAGALSPQVFAPLFEVDPPIEIVLIGTGSALAWPPADIAAAIRARGIGVEVMASREAARTYNLLLADGRQVAAYLAPL